MSQLVCDQPTSNTDATAFHAFRGKCPLAPDSHNQPLRPRLETESREIRRLFHRSIGISDADFGYWLQTTEDVSPSGPLGLRRSIPDFFEIRKPRFCQFRQPHSLATTHHQQCTNDCPRCSGYPVSWSSISQRIRWATSLRCALPINPQTGHCLVKSATANTSSRSVVHAEQRPQRGHCCSPLNSQ